MKTTTKPQSVTGLLAAASMVLPVSAATLHWDGTDTTGNADGGPGTWDTSITSNWDTAATGGANSQWTATNVASFGGSGDAVTVDAPGVSAQRLLFTANGYTLSGGDITLTGGNNSDGGAAIRVATGSTATINSKITSTNQLWLGDGGKLVLGNAANSINSWVVSGAATLEVSDFAQLGSGANTFYFNGNAPGTHTLVYTGTSASFTQFSNLYGIGAGTNAIDVTQAGTTVTLAQDIQNNGGGTFRKLGAGTLRMTADSDFTGASTVAAGTLQLGYAPSAMTVESTATLEFISQWKRWTKSFSGAGTITYSLDGMRFANDWSGFTGTVDVKSGTRCFFINPVTGSAMPNVWGSDSARFVFNNNATGSTSNSPVAIEFGTTNGGWASGSTVDVHFGSLEGGGANTHLGPGNYTAAAVGSATVNITVGGANLDATFAGKIVEKMANGATAITNATTSLIKTGTGTQALSGANTYNGATSIDNGTLRLDSTPGSGHVGQYWVGNGGDTGTAASLMLGGAGGTGGGVTLNNLIAINPGSGNNRTLGGTNAAGTTSTFAGTTYSNGGNLTVTSTNDGAILAFTNVEAIDLKSANVLFNGAGNTNISGAVYNSTGSGSVTKDGSGTLTLTGVNTYTGITTVNGGTLTLAIGGSLKFAIADASNTTITGSGGGTLNLSGGFDIDTSAVTASIGTWTLVDVANLTETFTDDFTVLGAGWSQSANVWTKSEPGKNWVFTEADGKLTLNANTNNFANWIAGYPDAAAKPGFDEDADDDGIPNGVENVLGSDPSKSSGGMREVAHNGSVFTFHHSRNNAMASDVSAGYEWSTDMVNWHASGATSGGIKVTIGTTVILDTDAPDLDEIEVTATVDEGSTGSLFVRLIATQQ